MLLNYFAAKAQTDTESQANVQNQKLTNSDVIEMVKIGLKEEIIVTKIKTSEVQFNTEIQALKQLQESSVSSSIITAIGAETIWMIAFATDGIKLCKSKQRI